MSPNVWAAKFESGRHKASVVIVRAGQTWLEWTNLRSTGSWQCSTSTSSRRSLTARFCAGWRWVKTLSTWQAADAAGHFQRLNARVVRGERSIHRDSVRHHHEMGYSPAGHDVSGLVRCVRSCCGRYINGPENDCRRTRPLSSERVPFTMRNPNAKIRISCNTFLSPR